MSEAFRSRWRWRTRASPVHPSKTSISNSIKLGHKMRLTRKKTGLFPTADLRQLAEEVSVKSDRQKQAGRQTDSRWLRCGWQTGVYR